MKLTRITACAASLALMVSAAPAFAIDITSLSSGTEADTWLDGTNATINQTRNGGAVTISNEQSLDGDGALRLSSPDGSGKATALYFGSSALGALASLSEVSYQYYRDSSSTNPTAQAPSLRLYVSDGAGRNGTLIYEPVYNGTNPIPEDDWQTVDALLGNWWLYEGGVFENFSLTLADWATGNVFTGPGGPKSGFGSNAVILGIDTGIGSGWNGESLAYVDNVMVAFGTSAPALAFNFQAQEVPEPASLALLGAGLAGLYLVRRRRKA